MTRLLFILLFLELGFLQKLHAQNWPEGHMVVKNLTGEVWYFNESEQKLLPFAGSIFGDVPHLHYIIPVRRHRGNLLYMELPPSTSIFYKEKILFAGNNFETNILWQIDSLAGKFRVDTIYITLYHKGGLKPVPAAILVPGEMNIESESPNPILYRNHNITTELLLIIVLLLVAGYALLLNAFPKTFGDFFAIEGIFSFRSRDESFNQTRMISSSTVSFLLVHAAMLAFLIIVYDQYNRMGYHLSIMESYNLIFQWLVLTIIVYIFILAKYILIYKVGNLFDLGQGVNVYFFDFIRLSKFFHIIIFSIVSVVLISWQQQMINIINMLAFIVVIFNLIRLIIIFFRLKRASGFNFLHLFSYLCITEIFPLIAGIKYFMVY